MAVNCPYCGQPIINDPALAGSLVECPHCDERFKMPGGSKRTGLYGRFNILHYILAGAVGLFIGGCGGCVVGPALIGRGMDEPKGLEVVGYIGLILLRFGPLIGASFAISLIWLYDLNRPKRPRRGR